MAEPYLEELRAATGAFARDFDLQEDSAREEFLTVELRLCNLGRRVGVEFKVDWREMYPSTFLFELTPAGEFIDRYSKDESRDGRAFDAGALLILRGGDSGLVGRTLRRKAEGEIERVFTPYVEALREVASDVLRGDFAVFEDLAQMVAEQRRQFGEA